MALSMLATKITFKQKKKEQQENDMIIPTNLLTKKIRYKFIKRQTKRD